MDLAHSSAGSGRRWRGRARWILRVVPYALVLLVLLGWELYEHTHSSNACELRTTEPGEFPGMARVYSRGLKHLNRSPQVVTVELGEELQWTQTNVCGARPMMAELLRAIAGDNPEQPPAVIPPEQRPAVIAIDKVYGRSACSNNDLDGETEALFDEIAALNKISVPVVIGAATHEITVSGAQSCLARTEPQLFQPVGGGSTGQAGGAKVEMGLTRLSQNPLNIPLEWPLTSADPDHSGNVDSGDSFALVTAELANPKLKFDCDLQKVIKSPLQPYTRVVDDPKDQMTKYDAGQLLCVADPTEAREKWNIPCKGGGKPTWNFGGKVVVIGAASDSDKYTVMNQPVYGYQLQAHYIAALLAPEPGYLRAIPFMWNIALVLYLVAIEMLGPYLETHRLTVSGRRVKPVLVQVALFAVGMLAAFIVPLWCNRFPPLVLMFLLTAIFITGLLYEGREQAKRRLENG